ncbi:hypothetical protein [Variovorax guangxiensis]|nr:hypothetical protein [Variovorax guangxiensis]
MAINEEKSDICLVTNAELRQPARSDLWDAAPCVGLPYLAATRTPS